ncbi:TauD/TfdA family dioxygenase [Lyngbya sp. PCC 8106]|uniref:TauD/TfdA family dioxygenase n=1 Tax=Lyngbya sp. (strain PCC 8106) TaxID=313612 RepID=UPI0000EAA41F|nr:TauD/TfdA family dioxygenase [Lyngbya sp. PCC 8106]EAW34386.1 gamma-butyrobetaine hydroxylase, putative [Lyngbya sp. PCC 8106]
MSPQLTQNIVAGDRSVTVNGKRFHYIWLRDNCLSPKYYHPTSFQKMYDISEVTATPKPLNIELTDEKLIVDWDEDPPHRSIFPISWLMSHAYDGDQGLKPSREKILWDKAWVDIHLPKWINAQSGDSQTWRNQLLTLGFTIVKNLPDEDLDNFISDIGPAHYLGKYGRYSPVKAIPNAQDLSLSAEGNELSPHTDITFMSTPPLVQLLYCVENLATGGESVLVDGFKVARDFQQHHPQYFEILTKVPVKFEQFYQEWEYYVSRTTPIIELEQDGLVSGIYFSHKNFSSQLPFDQVEEFYEAYKTFFLYLKNPAYQYWFRLEPGDCLLVENFRVLHGRKAFNPNSGMRHLEVAYMDLQYFVGREDFHRLKHLYQSISGG